MSGEVGAPRVRILSQHLEGDALDLRVAVEDSDDLRALQVAVNGVPVHPGMGKPLEGVRAELSERVVLGQGRNRVEVSAVNRAGFESRRATTVVERPPGDRVFSGSSVSACRSTGTLASTCASPTATSRRSPRRCAAREAGSGTCARSS